MKSLLCNAPLGFAGGWRQRIRTISLLLVALITMLTATVAFGQAAQDFDLACRSRMNGGGGISVGGNFGVLAAIGEPIAPQAETATLPTYSARSADFGLRAGFLPGYPTGTTAVTSASDPDQSFVSRLPILYNIVRIVRGGC